MTTHYIDLTLKPDPEISAPHLLGALMDRLHMALVEGQHQDIGVSFPGYSCKPRTLGNILRLHGNREVLEGFDTQSWLKGLRDHIHQSAINAAPNGALRRCLVRKQFKTNVERLRRRRMRRKGETHEQAEAAIPDHMARLPDLPYVQLHSRSTGQPFALFIAMQNSEVQSDTVTFNTYGLSSTTSIPWF